MKKAVAVAILTMTFLSGSVSAGNYGNSATNGWGTPSAPSSEQPQVASKSKIVGYTASFNLSQSGATILGTCPDGYAQPAGDASAPIFCNMLLNRCRVR